MRFIDWGKTFDMNMLISLGANEASAKRLCMKGHLYDTCTLLMSLIRLGRRTSSQLKEDTYGIAQEVYRYLSKAYKHRSLLHFSRTLDV